MQFNIKVLTVRLKFPFIYFRKECGIEKFVPYSHLEHLKPKELRKILSSQIKLNQNLTPPGQKQLSSMQAKLHYMKIVSELKTFGSRVFMVTLLVRLVISLTCTIELSYKDHEVTVHDKFTM